MTSADGQTQSATPADSRTKTSPTQSRIVAITISRLYGSGGGEIAARLAQRLGWRLVDREMIAQVAREMGVTEEEATEKDERVESFITRALRSMLAVYPSGENGVPPDLPDPDRAYQEALSHVIATAADEGRCVIVGRGAHAVLAGRRDVLKVLVTAPLPERVVYVARREGLDERAARERIQRKDGDRQRYVQTHYRIAPGEPVQYDLTVNTAVLALDDAVDLVLLAMECKAKRLALPAAELGPGAGMGRYPTRPEDVPLPAESGDAPTGNPEALRTPPEV